LSRVVRGLFSRRRVVLGAAALAVAFASGTAALLLSSNPGEVGQLAPRDPPPPPPQSKPASLKIASRPEGAAVLVDGKAQSERAPLTVRGLSAGEHEIVARLKGYSEARRLPTLAEGKAESVVLQLAPLPASEQVAVSIATVPPGAALSVDGKRVGTSPVTTTLPAGAQVEILASLDGYLPKRRVVVVGTTQEQEVSLDLDKSISSSLPGPERAPRPEPRPPRPEPRPEPRPSRTEPSEPGTLSVTCDPPATVVEGGRELGRTPLEIRVAPGSHELTLVNLEQGLRKPFTVVVRSGEPTEKSFRFQRGEVQFLVTPSADVYLNTRKMAEIPGPKFGVIEGEHVFELKNEELNKTRQVTVTVRPGQLTRVKVNLLED
jgi:hypothetical protein